MDYSAAGGVAEWSRHGPAHAQGAARARAEHMGGKPPRARHGHDIMGHNIKKPERRDALAMETGRWTGVFHVAFPVVLSP